MHDYSRTTPEDVNSSRHGAWHYSCVVTPSMSGGHSTRSAASTTLPAWRRRSGTERNGRWRGTSSEQCDGGMGWKWAPPALNSKLHALHLPGHHHRQLATTHIPAVSRRCNHSTFRSPAQGAQDLQNNTVLGTSTKQQQDHFHRSTNSHPLRRRRRCV